MSDNVVLSKHFDSLASAIQRCLSAGYAPTAYIPAGHDCVIDTVASTVDGGMWYELNGRVPIIKMHYGDYDFEFNTIAPLDAYKVIDLRGKMTNPPFIDWLGNTWERNWTDSGGAAIFFNADSDGGRLTGFTINDNKLLTRNESLTLGGKDFTIRFWYKDNINGIDSCFLRLYNSTLDDGLGIYNLYNTETQKYKLSIKLFGNSYTSENEVIVFANSTIYSQHVAHLEIDYSHSTNELKLFVNGELNYTTTFELPRTTFAHQCIGYAKTNRYFEMTELQIYDGVALHAANFTPTYTPN